VLLKSNPSPTLKSCKIARVYENPEDRERLLDALRKAGLNLRERASSFTLWRLKTSVGNET
jgi:hypothetical protein